MTKQKEVGTQFFKENLDDQTDRELVDLAKQGDEQAVDKVFENYKNLINVKANKYFIIGAEREDVVQEGRIGLYKAIQDFDPDKEVKFSTFANLCIERQLLSAIRVSNRQKHIPLNSSISINSTRTSTEEPGEKDLLDLIKSDSVQDPLDTITKREYYSEIGKEIDSSLSDFEKNVLLRYSMGYSYNKISEKLQTPIKSVDNAIQRIRKKTISKLLEEE